MTNFIHRLFKPNISALFCAHNSLFCLVSWPFIPYNNMEYPSVLITAKVFTDNFMENVNVHHQLDCNNQMTTKLFVRWFNLPYEPLIELSTAWILCYWALWWVYLLFIQIKYVCFSLFYSAGPLNSYTMYCREI